MFMRMNTDAAGTDLAAAVLRLVNVWEARTGDRGSGHLATRSRSYSLRHVHDWAAFQRAACPLLVDLHGTDVEAASVVLHDLDMTVLGACCVSCLRRALRLGGFGRFSVSIDRASAISATAVDVPGPCGVSAGSISHQSQVSIGSESATRGVGG